MFQQPTPRTGTKAEHSAAYLHLPPLLKALREEAGLTQRQMGQRLNKPQSWVYNCEAANRRVDVTEFIAWVRAYGGEPSVALVRLLNVL